MTTKVQWQYDVEAGVALQTYEEYRGPRITHTALPWIAGKYTRDGANTNCGRSPALAACSFIRFLGDVMVPRIATKSRKRK